MRTNVASICVAIAFGISAAYAETMKSSVSFNNGIGEKTTGQPANGMQVSYEIPLSGGELEGCKVAIVESLYGREDGAWGIFDIEGNLTCGDRGGFSYTSSGAWDGNGFHAAGHIVDGSGSGEFEGISGRVAQLGGGAAPKDDGTADISYDLVIETEG